MLVLYDHKCFIQNPGCKISVKILNMYLHLKFCPFGNGNRLRPHSQPAGLASHSAPKTRVLATANKSDLNNTNTSGSNVIATGPLNVKNKRSTIHKMLVSESKNAVCENMTGQHMNILCGSIYSFR